MQYGKNTVVVFYRVKNQNAESRLTLAPVMNFRDFHTMSHNHIFEAKQTHYNTKVKVILDNNSETPIYMNCSDGKYLKHIDDTLGRYGSMNGSQIEALSHKDLPWMASADNTDLDYELVFYRSAEMSVREYCDDDLDFAYFRV